MTLKFDRQI